MSTDARPVTLLSGSERRDILRDSLAVLFSSHVATACGVLASLVVRAAIGPKLIGIWTTVRSVLEYASYSSLGTNRAAGLDIAVAAGRGDGLRVRHVADVAMTVEVFTGSLVAIGLLAAAALNGLRHESSWAVAFTVAAVIAIVSRYHGFSLTVLRSRKQFPVLARARVFGAVADLILLAGAAYCFGFYGMVAAVIVAHLVNAWFVRHAGGLRFTRVLERQVVFGLVAAGWPIAAEALALAALRNVDRFVIVNCLENGDQQLGWYSIAIVMSAWAFDQSNLVANVIYPRLAETLGRTSDPAAVLRLALNAAQAIALTMVICSAVLLVVGVPVIDWLLPAFRPGLVAASGLIAAAAVLGVAMPLRYALLTIGRTLWMLAATAISAAVSLAGALVLVGRGSDGSGGNLGRVACNSAMASGLCLTAMLVLCCVDRRELWPAALRIAGAAAYAMVGTLILGSLRGNRSLELVAAAAWSFGPAWLLVQRIDWRDLLRKRNRTATDGPDVTDAA